MIKLAQAIGLLALVIAGLLGVFVLIRGPGHHWRFTAGPVTENCTTHEIDDGCSMFGSCFKCEPVCLPGTEPKLVAIASCGRGMN
jgi:hypothetical protein